MDLDSPKWQSHTDWSSQCGSESRTLEVRVRIRVRECLTEMMPVIMQLPYFTNSLCDSKIFLQN